MLKHYKPFIALSIILQIILLNVLRCFPEFVEAYYSNGLYILLSKIMRYSLGWLPFSFGDLIYGFGIFYIIRWLVLNRKRVLKDTKNWFMDVGCAVSIIYFIFHMLWGFNYYRQPLHLNLEIQDEYTTEQLVTFSKRFIEKSNTLHLQITHNDTVKVTMPFSKNEIMDLAPLGYNALEKTFPHLAYSPTSVKVSMFSLPLTYMGFSGYLNPITNEAQVDILIPSYKLPTTTSHEIAHQLGYAAENEANFIGCMAAMNHDNLYFKYSGHIFGLRHCLNELYRRDEQLFNELLETLNPGILKNYQESEDFWNSYQNPLEPIFKHTYNSYLKANNQDKGMESYSYVVALLVNYFEHNTL